MSFDSETGERKNTIELKFDLETGECFRKEQTEVEKHVKIKFNVPKSYLKSTEPEKPKKFCLDTTSSTLSSKKRVIQLKEVCNRNDANTPFSSNYSIYHNCRKSSWVKIKLPTGFS